MKAMVTGHRPERLGNKAIPAAMWLDEQLRELKPDIAISGLAEGVDQIFAELALKQHISLAAALSRKKSWNEYHSVVQEILGQVNEVVYTHDCYKTMVDAADIVLAVWDGKKWGGTWKTIEYALDQNKEVRLFPQYKTIEEENPLHE